MHSIAADIKEKKTKIFREMHIYLHIERNLYTEQMIIDDKYFWEFDKNEIWVYLMIFQTATNIIKGVRHQMRYSLHDAIYSTIWVLSSSQQ